MECRYLGKERVKELKSDVQNWIYYPLIGMYLE